MKRFVAVLLCCVILSTGLPAAADAPASLPRWSFEFKGGRFKPELPDWKDYYGSDSMGEYLAALGYLPLRALQLGTEVGYAYDSGQGLLPNNGVLGGEVSYLLVPVHVYVVVRGVFTAEQWVIPYIGGGWTRAYYKQTVKNQQTYKGHADGWNARAGLQLLINALDPNNAKSLRSDFGIDYTYLTLEAQKFRAEIDGAELGGTSYLLGLRLEF